ncbi:helix-turn-helix domain-containing protein [uncultured Brevibacillus sp.]|uniref:helix-turn-helix domain-containing protein n=1 Tax=uncultured Brevibacillus sp. TaxID=169970 RepID=UPI0025954C45|nr:helix-turn-helix transcriptional regulator [uncultured Brevibacillus sp.]
MIGETLKKLRAIYGLTSAQMCEELGISTSYLSEIENQKKMPSLELLETFLECECGHNFSLTGKETEDELQKHYEEMNGYYDLLNVEESA